MQIFEFIKKPVLSLPVLGGYQIFMITTGSSFHKTVYKRVWFSLFLPPKSDMLGKGIFIYTGSQYVSSWNFENSQFSQTGYYLLIGFFFLIQKFIINFFKSQFHYFLTNEQITNIVTNNFLTLNNILFIEVLHFNNFIPFKFTFKLF
jgi:hypothetical protein